MIRAADRGLSVIGCKDLARRIVIAVCFLGTGIAFGEGPAAPPVKDTIFARKILMNEIDGNMDEIETMLAPGGKLDLADAREHANNISVMLLAFPHLFPPSTNLWKPNADRDPGTDTYAAPELWDNFPQFYASVGEASKIALDAARARRPEQFRLLIAQLRAACNGCHAAYQKTD
jgi:cytochrome c556